MMKYFIQFFIIISFWSCGKSDIGSVEMEDFIEHLEEVDTGRVDYSSFTNIYVDFSSSMLPVLNDSTVDAVFKTLLNTTDYSNANFYRLGGDSIHALKKNSHVGIYDLLENSNNFSDIYAPIESAFQQMASLEHASIIVTDGEYYRKQSGETNFPYAQKAIRRWLKLGNTIDIIIVKTVSERNFFVFSFTPKNIEKEDIQAYNFINELNLRQTHIKHLFLQNDFIDLNKSIKVNPNININDSIIGHSKKYVYYNIYSSWNNIKKYSNLDSSAMNNMLFRGLNISDDKSVFYSIKRLAIKQYDIKDAYNLFKSDIDSGKTDFGRDRYLKKIQSVEKIFSLDVLKNRNENEIIIKLDNQFDRHQLRTDQKNMHKINILIDKVEYTNKKLLKSLIWKNNDGKDNTSIYYSVYNALRDNKIENEKTIFSYYIVSKPMD